MTMQGFKPWEHTSVWKTEGQFYTWLRGQLRRLWKDNPLRIDFKKRHLRPVTLQERADKKFHVQTKMVGECRNCLEWFPQSKLEVDHLIQAGSCSNPEEVIQFLENMVWVPFENMGLTCVPCHKIKSLAERRGISFEEAKVEKQLIAFKKLKASDQISKMTQVGLSLEKAGNSTKRVAVWKKYLRELNNSDTGA